MERITPTNFMYKNLWEAVKTVYKDFKTGIRTKNLSPLTLKYK